MSLRFLTAQWRSLAMLNYAVDPAILQPFVPRGTELDTWEGETFVSIVGFLFCQTRVLRAAIPMHRNFEEVNLRFYVRRKAAHGWRRGVTFLREIVPRPAIALVANTLYNERYIALPMRHSVSLKAPVGHAEYGWLFQQRWNTLRIETANDWQLLQNNSLEEFITEHYWGYAAARDGGCTEYRVAHPRWRVRPVTKARFDCDVRTLYGAAFAPFLETAPASAFIAEGSRVAVYRGTRIC